ncbi:MAG: ectonucleoside triphosphate diphosphohydrolase 1-like [Gammaproteobacteria bacterium]|jgi:hypothetical protein|nr:ectonucleoside triphosphate diphosphohydrolase 1-like [Gammaproteobacteria bacterium]
MSSPFKNHLKRLFVFFIATFSAITSAQAKTSPVLEPSNPLRNASSIIIIDAGSTGSRLHLFRYTVAPDDPQKIITIKEVLQKDITPGLATIATQPESLTHGITNQQHLQQYIASLLSAANQALSPRERQKTPVYLFGTAGMRNLPQETRAAVLADTTDIFIQQVKQGGYPIPNNPKKNINIINGSAEGLFSWITINYLMHRYDIQDFLFRRNYGVLDLGGASTQISVQENKAHDKPSDIYLQNGERKYPIYVHSYPMYGTNASQKSFKNRFGKSSDICFLQSGHANFKACQALIAADMYNETAYHQCTQRNGASYCSKMGVYQADIADTQFFAISGYYYIFNDLDLVRNIPSPGLLAKAGEKYCSLDWQTAIKKYPERNQITLNNDCFVSAWVYSLLKGYGLSDDTPLLTGNTINGIDTDWPLGAAIYLISQVQHEQTIYFSSL